jgi:CubicO group peptidase (beta-lactamase class C family)
LQVFLGRSKKMNMFSSIRRAALCAVVLCAILAHSGETFSAALDRTKARHKPISTRQIDDVANAAMRRFSLPGLAIVVVRDDKIVYQKGFGVTEVNKGNAVDTNTLFKVGSISKSITALAMALLVQEGKVKWDDSLSHYIPELTEANPLVAKLTIRQILSHQTGLDLDRLEPLLWPQPNEFKFANLITGLNVLGEGVRDGSTFRYSNLNYALTGEVVRRASGVPYGEFVREHIFQPLDMSCLVSEMNMAMRSRLAQPHMMIKDTAQVVRPDNGLITEGLDAAAGGVRCDAHAMGKWLLFQLNPRTSGFRITDAIWKDMHSGLAVTRTTFDDKLRPIEVESYGLGMQLVMAKDEFRFEHYGGVAGMLAYYAVYPSRGAGFAILMNMNSAPARKVLIDQLASLVTSKTIAIGPQSSAAAANQSVARHRKELDAQSQQRLFGRYQDKWFGEVSLCKTNLDATFTAKLSPRFRGRLVSIKQERIAILWDDQAINSDAIIEVAETRDSLVQRFTLTPLAESDFDFGAMNFRRIGACP